ncbi:MAG: thioredoxin family protein [Ignavibacteriales bacterium]|nr:thioredoxin family protein [Ignavibacteriales bacterium]
MKVKILGVGCARCNDLEQKVRHLNDAYQLRLEIEKVTDLKEMMQYGILTTPGLVVDGILRSYGVIPNDEQLLQWFKEQHS